MKDKYVWDEQSEMLSADGTFRPVSQMCFSILYKTTVYDDFDHMEPLL